MNHDCGICTLRSWRVEDLDALVRHANNAAVARQMRDLFPHPYTREAGEWWVAHASRADPETNFAIEFGGEAVGAIGLKLGTDVERVSAEVGYWLGEAVWGKGIATAALRGVTALAFEKFGLTRVFALPFADNLPSRRVLEKAGFTLDCVLRKSSIKHGQIRDQALYSRVRD